MSAARSRRLSPTLFAPTVTLSRMPPQGREHHTASEAAFRQTTLSSYCDSRIAIHVPARDDVARSEKEIVMNMDDQLEEFELWEMKAEALVARKREELEALTPADLFGPDVWEEMVEGEILDLLHDYEK